MAINWISDRLPTIEDADEDGDVLAHSSHVELGFRITRWDRVVRNQPWAHLRKAKKQSSRKIVQLLVADGVVLAVSDDGLAFSLTEKKTDKAERGIEYSWWQLPPLPQP